MAGEKVDEKTREKSAREREENREMNRDEALKCLQISKNKHSQGDRDGALKFCQKSINLYSTKEATEYLQFLQNQPMLKQRVKKQEKKQEQEGSEESKRPFTQEQVEGIQRIVSLKKKGDLYGILGLEKGCSDNEIKKAYRKFHPDKCGAPGTDECFKAISNAFTVLGDPDKRSNYDQFGIDSEAPQNSRRGFQSFRGQQFTQEISPEELFRMFMGNEFPGFQGPGFTFHTGGPFRTRFQTHRQHQQQGGNSLLSMLPLLVLFLFSILSLFGGNEDVFQFQKTQYYNSQRYTKNHNVQYFVNRKVFDRHYSYAYKLRDLENMVEREYLRNIQQLCHNERETQRFKIMQASGWFSTDQEALKRAKEMPMPWCERLTQWYTK